MKNDHLPPSMDCSSSSQWKEIGFLFCASLAGLVASLAWAVVQAVNDLFVYPFRNAFSR